MLFCKPWQTCQPDKWQDKQLNSEKHNTIILNQVFRALTGEPLIDQRVHVVRDESHGREVSALWMADDLYPSTLLPLPVNIWWLHTAETQMHVAVSLYWAISAFTTSPFTIYTGAVQHNIFCLPVFIEFILDFQSMFCLNVYITLLHCI